MGNGLLMNPHLRRALITSWGCREEGIICCMGIEIAILEPRYFATNQDTT